MPDNLDTYYGLFDLERGEASKEDVNEAFREMVKEVHPDHNDHPDAAERFRAVKNAREVLLDHIDQENSESTGTSRSQSSTAGHRRRASSKETRSQTHSTTQTNRSGASTSSPGQHTTREERSASSRSDSHSHTREDAGTHQDREDRHTTSVGTDDGERWHRVPDENALGAPILAIWKTLTSIPIAAGLFSFIVSFLAAGQLPGSTIGVGMVLIPDIFAPVIGAAIGTAVGTVTVDTLPEGHASAYHYKDVLLWSAPIVLGSLLVGGIYGLGAIWAAIGVSIGIVGATAVLTLLAALVLRKAAVIVPIITFPVLLFSGSWGFTLPSNVWWYSPAKEFHPHIFVLFLYGALLCVGMIALYARLCDSTYNGWHYAGSSSYERLESAIRGIGITAIPPLILAIGLMFAIGSSPAATWEAGGATVIALAIYPSVNATVAWGGEHLQEYTRSE